MHESTDVVVIGGGPGGSTTAGLLAKRGHHVVVIEKERFPRYHIGESLIPGVHPILAKLEASDEVDSAGLCRKYGVTLLWGRTRELWSVDFREGSDYDYVYQVKRAEFDNLLLRRARLHGAHVIEDANVTDVIFEGDRCVGVRYTMNGSDQVSEIRARIVVDASGQARVLARRLKLVEWHEDLKNVAIWTYFQGHLTYGGRKAGNILVENMSDGWLWFIPFSDNTVSVGFVGAAAVVSKMPMSLHDLLEKEIAESLEVSRLLAPARRVGGIRTTRDWSYTCRRFGGPGYLLVGDAAAFIDPLFSTGVALAMNSGSGAAGAISAILAEPAREAELIGRYEDIHRSFVDSIIAFVRYFYDPNKDKEFYWTEAQSIVDPGKERSAREDFISLISGMSPTLTGVSFEKMFEKREVTPIGGGADEHLRGHGVARFTVAAQYGGTGE
jgi:FAD-dependent halogenase